MLAPQYPGQAGGRASPAVYEEDHRLQLNRNEPGGRITPPQLAQYLEAQRQNVTQMLCDLIAIPSTRGGEGAAQRYLAEKLQPVCSECELVPVPESIVEDPDYSFPLEGLTYAGRPNLLAMQKGRGGGKSVVFNTHLDTVPPSPGQDNAFRPEVKDGAVYGRGACDAKGQAVTMVLVAQALAALGLPGGDVTYHFVIEEECGGNGTLAMVRRGCQADTAIVLEPSGMAILPSVRGAVWFDVTCHGRSGHSGRAGDVVSALKKAIQAIDLLEKYHAELLAASRHVPLFDQFPNPMPITFGELHAGDWPATAPSLARFRGVMGLLPNVTKEQVMAGMRQAIAAGGDEWLREHFDMNFIYKHDANVIPVDHPLVTSLAAACQAAGVPPVVTAMTASCDAWLYNNQLHIPTVVFGPGHLKYAHSREEHILVDDILKAAEVLVTHLLS